jgi:hypothetical protein
VSRVGVYLTNYNSEAYVRVALDSILGQEFKDFDLLVFDNYSTDGAPAIFREYAEKDPRVKVMGIPHGLAGIPLFDFAWKYLDKQSYDYSITIGGHDFWQDAQVLGKLVARMDSEIKAFEGNVALCYMDTWQVNMESKVCGRFQNVIQLGQVGRPFVPLVAITTVESPQLFGLWNERVRKAVSPIRHLCGGWDHLVVMEAALHGRIIFEGSAQLVMRAPPPTDSTEAYGQRHFSKENLARGQQDFIDQIEWLVHATNVATAELQGDARGTYRMMLTAAIVEAYMTLRGYNLLQIPGAQQQFTQNPLSIEIMKGAHHSLRYILQLIRTSRPSR